jgi:3-methyladenine DNA glycosylase/8-oxoguanine DNA glycosylase
VLEISFTPCPPFSLQRSARAGSDATRLYRDGVLQLAFEAGGAPALARVWQRRDGTLSARIETSQAEAAHDLLRFMLAVDADVRPFYRLAARDRLLAPALPSFSGYRPLRLATVQHALLKALAGQLIAAMEARRIEARVIRRACASLGDLRLPPTRASLARLPAAEYVRCGLAGRRAAALVRFSGDLELDRLRDHPTPAAVARIVRERTLGPWSAGVISLRGLGRYDQGLVGDLGLIRLCRHLWGRPVEGWETAALLEPYGEWAGLASVLLISHPLANRRGPAVAAPVRGVAAAPSAA